MSSRRLSSTPYGRIRRATSNLGNQTPAGKLFRAVSGAIRWIARPVVRICRLLGVFWLLRQIKRFVIWAAYSSYRFVYGHRRHIKSRAAVTSDALEELQNSRFAAALVRLALASYSRGWPLLPRVLFATVRNGFVVIAGGHLTAGQIPRALTTARMMNLLFRSYVRNARGPLAPLYFEILYRAHQLERIARESENLRESDNFYVNRSFGIAQLYQNRPAKARVFLQRAIAIHARSYLEYRLLGRTYMIEGRYDEAARAFRRSVALLPPTVMAHQNYAGRYDVGSYRPKAWELRNAGELLIYDNLNQLAEDQFLRGSFKISLTYYQMMLDYQQQIAQGRQLPRKILFPLWLEFEQFDMELPVRILPYEWVTQFGHIGLLDSVAKMVRLGLRPRANYVVLAPPDKISNDDYLSYWEKEFCIVRDRELVDEMFPYQRYYGENFMAYPSRGPLAEPWTRAAARAQYAWAEAGNKPLLELTAEDRELGADMLTEFGLSKEAWYVGLHAREGGYHGETRDGVSTHRNAQIEDYFPAIEEIISRGGVVIRLGDASMRPLPVMRGVIDYARSPMKSSRMDLFLLATSRFVIGTTSGLTTAALSFGTPMVLVNCISNDWQLWTDGVDFITKKIYDRHQRRYLSLAEMHSQPIQGYLINNMVLERHGYTVEANSPEEIHAAVAYKLDILQNLRSAPTESDPLLSRYRKTMSHNPFMFGAARPALPFLEANPELLSEPLRRDERTELYEQWDDGVTIAPTVAALPLRQKIEAVPSPFPTFRERRSG